MQYTQSAANTIGSPPDCTAEKKPIRIVHMA